MKREDLEAVVKRSIPRIQNFGQKDVCWPWTGRKTQIGTRIRRRFVYGLPPTMVQQFDKPYGIVQISGKLVKVAKLVFEYFRPETQHIEGKWKLHNTCGDTLCCNPDHWEVLRPGQSRKRKKAVEMPTTPPDPDEMMAQDCEDLLDQIFAAGGPSDLEGVLKHEYMMDFSRELIMKTLHKMGKGHMCDE